MSLHGLILLPAPFDGAYRILTILASSRRDASLGRARIVHHHIRLDGKTISIVQVPRRAGVSRGDIFDWPSVPIIVGARVQLAFRADG